MATAPRAVGWGRPAFLPLHPFLCCHPQLSSVPATAPGSCPTLRPGSQGWTEPRGRSLAWRSSRFADQRFSPVLQEQSLGSRNPEHPCARLAVSVFRSCRWHPHGHHLFLGRGKSLSPLSTRGREWGEVMPPVTSPLPHSQASFPKQFHCIIDVPLTPTVASSCKHFRPVTFILKTNKTPITNLPDDPVYSACTVCGLK